MKHWTKFIWVIVLVTVTAGVGAAVTESEIKAVSAKTLLTDGDLALIDTYVQERYEQMTRALTPDDMAEGFAELKAYARSTASVAQTVQMYGQRYAQAILNKFPQAMSEAENLDDAMLAVPLRIFAVQTLSIADHPLTIDELVRQLGNSQAGARYWALRGLMEDTISAFLNDDANTEKRDEVIAAIDVMLAEEQSGLVLIQVTPTVATLADLQKVADSFTAVVDKRVARYADWSVTDEFQDVTLLKDIFGVLLQVDFTEENRAIQTQLVTAAGKLYAAGFSRFTQGSAFPYAENQMLVLISDRSLDALQTLLLEGENYFYRITNNGAQRSRFVNLVRRNDTNPRLQEELLAAFDSLLGVNGIVTEAFSLSGDGGAAPFAMLPDPPAVLVDSALQRQDLSEKLIEVEP